MHDKTYLHTCCTFTVVGVGYSLAAYFSDVYGSGFYENISLCILADAHLHSFN
jgi:hypothetical protein